MNCKTAPACRLRPRSPGVGCVGFRELGTGGRREGRGAVGSGAIGSHRPRHGSDGGGGIRLGVCRARSCNTRKRVCSNSTFTFSPRALASLAATKAASASRQSFAWVGMKRHRVALHHPSFAFAPMGMPPRPGCGRAYFRSPRARLDPCAPRVRLTLRPCLARHGAWRACISAPGRLPPQHLAGPRRRTRSAPIGARGRPRRPAVSSA
jgi:hypothetical protein